MNVRTPTEHNVIAIRHVRRGFNSAGVRLTRRRFTPQGWLEPIMQGHAKSVCIELAGWQLVSEPPAQ